MFIVQERIMYSKLSSSAVYKLYRKYLIMITKRGVPVSQRRHRKQSKLLMELFNIWNIHPEIRF